MALTPSEVESGHSVTTCPCGSKVLSQNPISFCWLPQQLSVRPAFGVHGLQGSPRIKTSESFFHELETAVRSCSKKSKEWRVPALQTRENSVAYPGTNEVLRGFNRDTKCLFAGLLGVVVIRSHLRCSRHLCRESLLVGTCGGSRTRLSDISTKSRHTWPIRQPN